MRAACGLATPGVLQGKHLDLRYQNPLLSASISLRRTKQDPFPPIRFRTHFPSKGPSQEPASMHECADAAHKSSITGVTSGQRCTKNPNRVHKSAPRHQGHPFTPLPDPLSKLTPTAPTADEPTPMRFQPQSDRAQPPPKTQRIPSDPPCPQQSLFLLPMPQPS